jgi:hypothetical protein
MMMTVLVSNTIRTRSTVTSIKDDDEEEEGGGGDNDDCFVIVILVRALATPC